MDAEKGNFTRQEVIEILDWLIDKRCPYHSSGYNGWDVYGRSPHYGVNSEHVLKDIEKQLFKI